MLSKITLISPYRKPSPPHLVMKCNMHILAAQNSLFCMKHRLIYVKKDYIITDDNDYQHDLFLFSPIGWTFIEFLSGFSILYNSVRGHATLCLLMVGNYSRWRRNESFTGDVTNHVMFTNDRQLAPQKSRPKTSRPTFRRQLAPN